MKWLAGMFALLVCLGLSGCDSAKRLTEVGSVDSLRNPPETTPTNSVNTATFAWSGGDWSANVAWEARHAMSARQDGTSNWPVPADGYGPRWIADRCYTGNWYGEANDPYALSKVVAESFGYVGTIGHEPGGSHHFSGWCTFFFRDVLYRSSYGARRGCHLTTPNFCHGSMWDWCTSAYMTKAFESAKPGWAGLKPPPSEHVFILDQRATVNGRDGWWVIDGNYVGSFLIGRHFMPMTVLKASYWGWAPTLATSD